MIDFQQKKKIYRVLYSPAVVIVLLLGAVYALYSTWSLYQKYVQSRREVEVMQQNTLNLQSKNRDVDSQINNLHTTAGIEKEIRAKYGVAKPDEHMAVIVSTDDEATTSVSKQTIWQRIKYFFGF